ncbi:hypothetical protein ACU4GD_02455 [Cupriavidus basilensis]
MPLAQARAQRDAARALLATIVIQVLSHEIKPFNLSNT